jgi:hypothetical protein
VSRGKKLEAVGGRVPTDIQQVLRDHPVIVGRNEKNVAGRGNLIISGQSIWKTKSRHPLHDATPVNLVQYRHRKGIADAEFFPVKCKEILHRFLYFDCPLTAASAVILGSNAIPMGQMQSKHGDHGGHFRLF